MNKELSLFDTKCLNLTIDLAELAYKAGDFPVGAVLTIDDEIVDTAKNEKNTKKSWVAHAENSLIIKNCVDIQIAHKQKKSIKLYSSLEPCIQCLGASVMNRINQIIYIQNDPEGGACDLPHNAIGSWYSENWPHIKHAHISDEPRRLLAKYIDNAIKEGNTSPSCKKAFDYYSKDLIV